MEQLQLTERALVPASQTMEAVFNGTDAKLKARFMSFQFLFAAATAHEMTHIFVAFLAGGSDDYRNYTPPGVSHLTYAQPSINGVRLGESGRHLENRLFGGSLEFFRDPQEDDGQVSTR